ncbi:MAG: dTDP-4-dehydro-6-deoxy-alpha-D-gulose 4-ketoreductase [Candidatus Parcubacteria bacterium]|jgi:nucleoside-diphosphate-sugar epimerase
MPSSPRTVLVIGAHGFVGRALCTTLVAQGTRVVGVVRRAVPADQRVRGVRYLVGDITQPAFARRAARGAEVIHYLAAAKRNAAYHLEHAFEIYEGNVRPLLAFLAAIRTLPPKTIVYASSILAAYAADDASPTVDGYAQGKYACELAVQAFASETAWRAKIIRLAAIYGPGQDTNPATANMIASLMHKIRTSDAVLEVWGTGRRRMQFIHVADVVNNLIAASRAAGTLFTVGHPEIVTVDAVARQLMATMGKRLRIRHDTSKPDKPSRIFRFNNPARPVFTLTRGFRTMRSA